MGGITQHSNHRYGCPAQFLASHACLFDSRLLEESFGVLDWICAGDAPPWDYCGAASGLSGAMGRRSLSHRSRNVRSRLNVGIAVLPMKTGRRWRILWGSTAVAAWVPRVLHPGRLNPSLRSWYSSFPSAVVDDTTRARSANRLSMGQCRLRAHRRTAPPQGFPPLWPHRVGKKHLGALIPQLDGPD